MLMLTKLNPYSFKEERKLFDLLTFENLIRDV